MAFFPNNNNYRSYNNIFNSQRFSSINNNNLMNKSPMIHPIHQNINNQIITNRILLTQNVPTKSLRRNNSFIIPSSMSNKILGYTPNNIYLNQPQITNNIYQRQSLNQNINYQIPRNNIYNTISQNRNPLYSHMRTKTEIRPLNYVKIKPLLSTINFKKYPLKVYHVSLRPNHYIFRRRKNPKELEEIERRKNEKINKMLEDACIYGNTIKEKIKQDKLKHPGKYISTKEALEKEIEDPELFALGLLASILEQNNMETAIINDKYIAKENNNGNKFEELQITIKKNSQVNNKEMNNLQFLTSGMIGKKKYELYFEINEQRFNEILNNPVENKKFKEKIKQKISKDYNISKDKIVVLIPDINRVQTIFHNDRFNDLDIEEFKQKFKNETEDNFKELTTLKEIQTSLILPGCVLSKADLDYLGNRIDWPKNEKRGGEKYISPEGWIGIGLKALDKYGENNTWLDMQNKEGEWVVAYHGVGRHSEDVNKLPGKIFKEGFKKGANQEHKDCEDYFHPGQKVGEGVYCTPRIDIAELYSGHSEFNGKKYKTVIMTRVNPKARRHCINCETSRVNIYWVVNGTSDEIRPYRILYKRDLLFENAINP